MKNIGFQLIGAKVPVRKIPKSYKSITGLVASDKNQRMISFESSLERDLILLVEFDLNVEYYEEQPLVIDYVDSNGEVRTYTPDLFVRYRKDVLPAKWNQPSLYEVKHRHDLFANWKELKPKFRAARAYAKERGWIFKIWTEKEIRTPYLYNVKFLRHYRNLEINENQVKLLLKAMDDLQESRPETLLLAIYKDRIDRATLMPAMWHLISIGMIETDLTQRLTMSSHIWSSKET